MKAFFKALKNSGRRFVRHGRGNVALTFALAVTPIILSVGAAVDYSMANRTKAELDAVADAAALLAVNQQALSLTPSGAKSEAQTMFKAQAAKIARLNSSKATVTVTDTTSGRTAVVDYTAVVPNAFMGVIGVNTTTLKGESTAATPIPTYIDFYLLLDNTPSMGVGATTADITKMVNNTPDQCAFACHDVTNANSYYNLAKSLGVTTRIDVMRLATQQLMDTASSAEIVSSQYRMAVYTFGASATAAGLTTVTSLTSSLSSVKSAAANIDLMAVSGQGQNNDQDTDFDSVLPAISNAIANPGNGTSSGSPQKYLFFVSDGVADANNPSGCSQPTTGGRCQEPINVALCTAIKKRGIKIAVLYTTYLDLPTNAWYNTWIAPFNAGPYGPSINSKIAANMQACASPGFYFEVSPTAGIPDAMNALFQKVVAQARLTK
jgi:Flp pilus assembly protein TadG